MEQFFRQNLWALALVIAWTLFWKGWALWKAARANSKGWFIVLLVINTIGILEIIYIFAVSKGKRPKELVQS